MKRREFIIKSAIGTAALSVSSLPFMSFDIKNAKRITILHTNDTHSHIDPFPLDHGNYPGQGGVARRATLLKKIRRENKNVLLLDAGDMFQGTPYFNYYGGELEIKMMNMLGYDAGTIGNHEFDNGVGGLAAQVPNAQFPIISANYDFSNTVMNGLTQPYKIFIKDGIKIGVFGLGVKLEGLVNKREYGETNYLDPIEMTQEMTSILKHREKCDLIICLSHLGYDYRADSSMIGDIALAKATQHIDLIIGGHTHTFLDKPTIVQNKEGVDVLINQVGCFGLRLGQIDFFFDETHKKTHQARSIIV